jgi:hypothetical protein
VYIVSNDTCPPFYWYSGVNRRSVQHVPPMLAGGGTYLNTKRHLKKRGAIHIMVMRLEESYLKSKIN